MTVNRLLNQSHTIREQEMVESLVIEAIQAKGRDVKYMVREMVNRDPLFGESTVSEFKDYAEVEMYLGDIQNFDGQGDIFSKFGMGFQMTDTASFEVSVRRFREELGKYELDRPREGDLIYYPLNDSLWEIRRVKRDPNFFQLGRNYRHILECSLFQFSHETLPADDDLETFAGLTGIDLSPDSAGKLSETLGLGGGFDESEIIKEENDARFKPFDPANPF